MKLFRRIVIVAVIALLAIFAYSYSRNPNLSATTHASAVGFVLARPFSVDAWQGLACPHRSAVTDLVTKSMAPQLCGKKSDGGAMARARRFQTEGPVSCWALFDGLRQQSMDRFSGVISGSVKPGPAVADICRRAEELLGKAALGRAQSGST